MEPIYDPSLANDVTNAVRRVLGNLGRTPVVGPRGHGQSAINEIRNNDSGVSRRRNDFPNTGLFWGIVRAVDDGSPEVPEKLRGVCQIEVPGVYGIIFARPMPRFSHFSVMPGGGFTPETITGDHELPQVDDHVLIAFIQTPVYNRNVINAVILGVKPNNIHDKLLLDKNGQPELNKRINVHPSFQWRKVNAKGDLEMKFPDGTFITVKEAAGSTPPNAAADLTEKRDPPIAVSTKTITISHATGAFIRMKTDGTIEIDNSNVASGTPGIEIKTKGIVRVGTTDDVIINAVDVDVNASGNANVTAAGDVKVEATGGNATVKADAGDVHVEGENVIVNAATAITATPMFHTHEVFALPAPTPITTAPPTGTTL